MLAHLKIFHGLKFWNIYCEYLRPQALKIWKNQGFREYCRTIPGYKFSKLISTNLCQEGTGEASKTLVGIHFAAIQAQELQICLLPFEIHCQPLKVLGRHNAPSETFQNLNWMKYSIIIHITRNEFCINLLLIPSADKAHGVWRCQEQG